MPTNNNNGRNLRQFEYEHQGEGVHLTHSLVEHNPFYEMLLRQLNEEHELFYRHRYTRDHLFGENLQQYTMTNRGLMIPDNLIIYHNAVADFRLTWGEFKTSGRAMGIDISCTPSGLFVLKELVSETVIQCETLRDAWICVEQYAMWLYDTPIERN